MPDPRWAETDPNHGERLLVLLIYNYDLRVDVAEALHTSPEKASE